MDLSKLVLGMETMIRALLGTRYLLSFQIAADLGVTRADPTQLEQVVLNLIVNARDAMPDGGNVTIRTANVDLDDAFVRAHPGSRPGSYVSLAVADTGIGMEERVKARIFEPFFTTKGENQGTGLGLAIVFGLVKQTGSYIAVDSEINCGTTFTVYFPRSMTPLAELQPVGTTTTTPTLP